MRLLSSARIHRENALDRRMVTQRCPCADEEDGNRIDSLHVALSIVSALHNRRSAHRKLRVHLAIQVTERTTGKSNEH